MKDYFKTVAQVALVIFAILCILLGLILVVWCFIDFSIEPATTFYKNVMNASGKDYRIAGISFIGISMFFALFRYTE